MQITLPWRGDTLVKVARKKKMQKTSNSDPKSAGARRTAFFSLEERNAEAYTKRDIFGGTNVWGDQARAAAVHKTSHVVQPLQTRGGDLTPRALGKGFDMGHSTIGAPNRKPRTEKKTG